MPSDRRRAVDAVIAALTAVGITAATSAEDLATSLTVEVNGVCLDIDVKVASTVTPESLVNQLRRHSGTSPQAAPVHLHAADRIVAAAREVLREQGWSWLDLRGHLHLSGPGVLVDTAVPVAPDFPRPVDLFAGKVALEVACALLLNPGTSKFRPPTRTGTPPVTQFGLRRNDLTTRSSASRCPGTPELFWETTSAWRPARTTVSRVALLDDPTIADALHTGRDTPSTGVGWALTETMAAAAYGAPAGVRAGYPPDLYVPDTTTAHRAEALLGVPTSDAARGASIRIAPVPQVCSLRFPAPPGGPPWPLAHPLFVALDLAADPGRGREILQGWNPPQEVTRVW